MTTYNVMQLILVHAKVFTIAISYWFTHRHRLLSHLLKSNLLSCIPFIHLVPALSPSEMCIQYTRRELRMFVSL